MTIATPERYAEMLDAARRGGYAYPAINVTSSQTLNAALKGFADAESDGIIQISVGGAAYVSGIGVNDRVTGPLAVNMATFIGASQGGVLGALCATLGVVLPSFFIILLIAALIHDLLKYAGVEAFLSGVRPCVVALILSTAFTMGLSTLLGISTAAETPSPAWRGIGILAILAGVRLIWQKARGKAPSPIGMILLSAVLGAVLYQ